MLTVFVYYRKRKKRSLVGPRYGDFEAMVKPKGGFVNCTCNWGLFRDRNVTLREPVCSLMYNSMLRYAVKFRLGRLRGEINSVLTFQSSPKRALTKAAKVIVLVLV